MEIIRQSVGRLPRKPAIVTSTLLVAVLVANILSGSIKTNDYSENYPEAICPPTLSGLNSGLSTPSTHTPYRVVKGTSFAMREIKALRYAIGANPVALDVQGITPLLWQSRSGAWAGGVRCESAQSSQWFVGGAANVTSRGRLLIVNSGLSDAIVDVDVWSNQGAQPSQAITVKASTYANIGLDTLAPGADQIALHVSPRSGRVNAFMLDERGRGLRSLGGDFVNPTTELSKDFFISGIPQASQERQKGKSKKSKGTISNSHTLRVLVPGSVAARFSVEVISADGIFSPVGFASRTAAAGTVTNFDFDPNLGVGNFSLHVTSDQPIGASVASNVKSTSRTDFVWSTPTPELREFSIATMGLNPVITFTGEKISLAIRVLMTNGKTVTYKIKGSDLVVWRAPAKARTVTFQQIKGKIYAGALQSSPNGTGFYPLVSGSNLTKSSIPLSNIRVLNP